MRHIFLGLSHTFDDPEIRYNSEKFLLGLLGYNCVVNRRYLREHPEAPLLYDSGVTYAPPDQADSANRISPAGMTRVAKLLKKEGADSHRIETVLFLLNGVEEFLDVPTLYKRGEGDCNELVPARVAELWNAGVMASPYLTAQDVGTGIVYHALVMHPDGTSEDPSLLLGMGGAARAAERQEEISHNQERYDNEIAAAQLAVASGADPAVLAQRIDRLGLLPKSGVWADGQGGRRAA